MPGTRPGMTELLIDRLRPRPVDDIEARSPAMNLNIGHLSPVISLIAGILILIMPRLLNFIVAIYLIIIGVIGLGLIR